MKLVSSPARHPSSPETSSLIAGLRIQARVIGALLMRDLRTKFGRTFFGPLILVGWPLSHALTILLFSVVIHRIAPFGSDSGLFFATGVLPYILCFYPARFIMIYSIHFNRGLLSVPVIKPMDLVLAQGISQALIAFWVAFLFLLIISIAGVGILPERPYEAIYALTATVYFGFSFGCLGGVLYGLLKPWLAIQILAAIVMYLTSGALFLPDNLPQTARYLMSFNPLFHCVEWFRAAYYENYGYGLLSRTYLVVFSTVLLWLALCIERGFRGRLLHT